MNVWAVVPARAKSAGYPGKNVAELDGHPLVGYSIAATKSLPFVAKTICTSDDAGFLHTADRLGADICLNRPSELADGLARDFSFFNHILKYCSENTLDLPDAFLLLRVVTPLRYRADLLEAYKIFSSEPCSSLRSVATAKSTPYKCWTRISSVTNEVRPFCGSGLAIDEPFNAPRQILPEVLASTGSFEFIKAKTLIDERSVSGAKVLGYKVRPETFIDIDSHLDLLFCETLLKKFDFIRPDGG